MARSSLPCDMATRSRPPSGACCRSSRTTSPRVNNTRSTSPSFPSRTTPPDLITAWRQGGDAAANLYEMTLAPDGTYPFGQRRLPLQHHTETIEIRQKEGARRGRSRRGPRPVGGDSYVQLVEFTAVARGRAACPATATRPAPARRTSPTSCRPSTRRRCARPGARAPRWWRTRCGSRVAARRRMPMKQYDPPDQARP